MENATRSYDAWIGHDVYDADGDKIGEIQDIFYDNVTQRPEWLSVKTGMFGSKHTFVPIQGASRHGENDLQVSYTKDFIKGAPNIDADVSMTPEEESRLWQYYEYDYATTTKTSGYGYGKSYDRDRVDKGYDARWQDEQVRTQDQGEVVATETVTNEKVVKEAQPQQVRLRKYQWTEQVPVQHEEVRVEQVAEGQVEREPQMEAQTQTTRGQTRTQTRPRNA